MSEPDIEKLTWHLAAAVTEERREAILYTLLTVLCTPAFVALAGFGVAILLFDFILRGEYDPDAATVYLSMTVFLAGMLASVLIHSWRSCKGIELHKKWLAGAGVFLVLLLVTYGTSLKESRPAFFAVVYAVAGFLTLGLIGQVPLPPPSDDRLGRDYFVLAIATFIASAYGQLFSASWLWVPPKPPHIRLGARVLCRLAASQPEPLSTIALDGRTVSLLSRLKLIQIDEERLHLTPRGLDFMRTAVTAPSDPGKDDHIVRDVPER